MGVFFHHCCFPLCLYWTNGTCLGETKDNVLRTGTAFIQSCQSHESNSASAFCYLTLSWVHYCFCSPFFSGFSLTLLGLFVGRSAPFTLSAPFFFFFPFCALPNMMTSWKVCMLVFFPHCVFPVPLHQMCNLGIQKSITNNWSVGIVFCFCLFLFSFPNSRISFLRFPTTPSP